MKQKYIWTAIIVGLFFLTGCKTDEIEDLKQEMPVVLFENDNYSANVVITEADNFPEVRLRLFGKKLDHDLTLTVTVDEANTDATIGTEFSLSETNVTIKAGESYAIIPYTIDRDELEADVNKKVKLTVSASGNGIRSTQIATVINLKKTIIDLNPWAGDYTFVGDGWERDSEIKLVAGENYKLLIYSFWGNGIDMEADVDVSDPYNPKVVVSAGTLLDYGWDAQGQWYLRNDLIGVFDKDKMEIVFTQFDYVCDDGTEGSFPWCIETCKLVKN